MSKVVTKKSIRVSRADGWGNQSTGLGLYGRDKVAYHLPIAEPLLQPQMLSIMWHYSDLAARIVKELVEHSMRQGFSFVDEGDGGLVNDAKTLKRAMMKKWGVHEIIVEADIWGRLFGDGYIMLGIVGSGEQWQPLDDEKVKKNGLKFLAVYDRRDVLVYERYSNPLEPKFGEPSLYRLQPSNANGVMVPAASAVIHESRMIRFGGTLTAPLERSQNGGHDHSVLQRVFTVLQETQSNWQSIVGLMGDFGQAVVKLANLIKILAQKGDDALEERILRLDMRRSSSNTILLDADKEDFERKATPVAGAAELLDRTWQRLAAAAEMPVTVLMGTSPAGMNATGESDMRQWYDRVAEHREKVIAPRLERLARIIATSEGIQGVDDLALHWPSLWQPTEKERAEARFYTAQSDEKYVSMGAVLPEEIAMSRFGASGYSAETKVDLEARKRMLEAETQKAIATAEADDPVSIDPKALPPKQA